MPTAYVCTLAVHYMFGWKNVKYGLDTLRSHENDCLKGGNGAENISRSLFIRDVLFL